MCISFIAVMYPCKMIGRLSIKGDISHNNQTLFSSNPVFVRMKEHFKYCVADISDSHYNVEICNISQTADGGTLMFTVH